MSKKERVYLISVQKMEDDLDKLVKEVILLKIVICTYVSKLLAPIIVRIKGLL